MTTLARIRKHRHVCGLCQSFAQIACQRRAGVPSRNGEDTNVGVASASRVIRVLDIIPPGGSALALAHHRVVHMGTDERGADPYQRHDEEGRGKLVQRHAVR